MRHHGVSRSTAVAVLSLLFAGFCAGPGYAADKLTVGTVGQASANFWPELIAAQKGFFSDEGLDVDVVYVQSSAALVQQLAAGSLGVAMSAGLADPVRAAA